LRRPFADYVEARPDVIFKINKADMINQNLIKVVKRAERERLEGRPAAVAAPALSARGKARQLATTVKEWISEFERARPVRLQELRRQLGWPEIEGDSLPYQADEESQEGKK
jgi:hypothetical protein